ncbi:MAG: cysteine desulfurase [Asgard group archaeon]|nr:cysteine desulfurase [Asgard group archaeon]
MKYMIKTPPDYLPLTNRDFVRHFSNLSSKKKYDLSIHYEKFTKIIGYSCRALFDMCMEYFGKKDLVIATTPIHHTSFRNIIEKYVKPENIHIIKLNDKINEIDELPKLEKCDLVVITHLFGQDMDLSALSEFKKKHKCLIIEDRVQGGSLDKKFSHKNVDISLYSMAMDKRPIALGGGFMYIDNKHKELIKDFLEIIKNLPEEKPHKRFKDLLKKIPTYLLYNSRALTFFFVGLIDLMGFFNKKINILSVTKLYRSSNPGFNRQGYMLKPSSGLLKSMYENFHKYKEVENVYTKNFNFFFNCFSSEFLSYFFPWYRGEASVTPYNTIQIEEHLVDQFLEFLSHYYISSLPNPTYKLFDISYENYPEIVKFNNGIAYLPCVANMTKDEIIYLSERIKEFYKLHNLSK